MSSSIFDMNKNLFLMKQLDFIQLPNIIEMSNLFKRMHRIISCILNHNFFCFKVKLKNK